MELFFIIAGGVALGQFLSNLAMAFVVMVRANRARKQHFAEMQAGSPDFQEKLRQAAAIVQDRMREDGESTA